MSSSVSHEHSQQDDNQILDSPSDFFYADKKAQDILLAFNDYLMTFNQSFGTVVEYFK